jgi:DNA polymerase-1
LQYPELSCDIEAFSLRFNEAGIATIAFAPDTERFVAFACDYKENIQTVPLAEKREDYGRFVPNPEVRALLKWFFTEYKGRLTFHNAAYDVKVLVYTLWMEHLLDQKGLLDGLMIMTARMDDTKIIAYLAINSTAGNILKLKELAQEFAGNWAVDDIKDVRKVPLKQLLQYNGVDALSTNYVKRKFYPRMVADQQEGLYHGLMMPSQRLIVQIELTGLPMNKAKVEEVEAKLQGIHDSFDAQIRRQDIIPRFEEWATRMKWQKDYEDRKADAKNPDKIFPKDWEVYKANKWFKFNPGSPDQLQALLYSEEFLGLPVIDKTDTKQPATGEKTLKKLLQHPIGEANKELLEGLIGVSQVSTILSNFIPAFKRAIAKAPDGIVWLHGSFNLGGTVSGRLSSSDPNMQNIPAKSIFAKVIKECFMAPSGWLFAGADFNSLEDYISALTTKDPNKLKVYIDGFDGHALRAAYYFKEDLEKEGMIIDMNDPKSVNILKKLDHWARQKSKTPTFALTYQGTYHTLMANLGWPEKMAKEVEAAYHTMYKVSDDWIQDKLEQASKDGYVTVAFGLRLRTPLLAQVMWGGAKMPYEASAEGRTAGNALGQSYGLLNNRAAVEFWEKVWASKYRYDILPVALIHDAIYMLVKDDPEVVEWANRELIKSMQWQELPEIQHDTVKLGAALDIFWPNWANAITLPNDADQATIKKVCKEAMEEYRNKEKKAA